MKAYRWFIGLVFSLVVLLSACGQTPEPRKTLEPENHVGVQISGSSLISTTAFQDICRRYAPLCDMFDESFVSVPVKVNPLCLRAICNNPMDVLTESNYRFDYILPSLTQTATQFGQNFKLEVLDANGKVLARGLADTKTPRIALSAKLPKGKFNLRVQVLNADVAKLIQSSPSKYPFNFIVSATK
jgi:hypothetical protein